MASAFPEALDFGGTRDKQTGYCKFKHERIVHEQIVAGPVYEIAQERGKGKNPERAKGQRSGNERNPVY